MDKDSCEAEIVEEREYEKLFPEEYEELERALVEDNDGNVLAELIESGKEYETLLLDVPIAEAARRVQEKRILAQPLLYNRDDPEYLRLVQEVEQEAGYHFKEIPYVQEWQHHFCKAYHKPLPLIRIAADAEEKDVREWHIIHELRHVLQDQNNPLTDDACNEFLEGWAGFSERIPLFGGDSSKAYLNEAIDALHRENYSSEYVEEVTRERKDLYGGSHAGLDDPYVLGYIVFKTVGEAYGKEHVNKFAMTAAPNREEFEGIYRRACQKLSYTPILDMPGLFLMFLAEDPS
jgi:hypothetical protein